LLQTNNGTKWHRRALLCYLCRGTVSGNGVWTDWMHSSHWFFFECMSTQTFRLKWLHSRKKHVLQLLWVFAWRAILYIVDLNTAIVGMKLWYWLHKWSWELNNQSQCVLNIGYWDGVRLCLKLGRKLAHFSLPRTYTSEYGAVVEWYQQGKTERLWGKPIPVPFRTPQIPHKLPWARTWVSAARLTPELSHGRLKMNIIDVKSSIHVTFTVHSPRLHSYQQKGNATCLNLRIACWQHRELIPAQLYFIAMLSNQTSG
jgi:hypothetical protein